jgi:hypothetical protein
MQIPRMSRSFRTARFVRLRLSFGVAATAPRRGGITRPTEDVFGTVAVAAGPSPVPVRDWAETDADISNKARIEEPRIVIGRVIMRRAPGAGA